MDIIAMCFAILGAALVASKSRKVRFTAFCSFNVANLLWISIALYQTLPLGFLIQCIILFVFAIIGLVNNWKE